MLLHFNLLWQEFHKIILQTALDIEVYCIAVIKSLDDPIILIFLVNKFNHKKDEQTNN